MDKSNGSSQYDLEKRKRHFELKFSRLKRSRLSDHPIRTDDSFRTKRKRHFDNDNNNKSVQGSASDLSYITYKSNTNFSRIDSLQQLQQPLNSIRYDQERKKGLVGSLSKPVKASLSTEQEEKKKKKDQFNIDNIINKYENISTTTTITTTKTNLFNNINKSKIVPNSTPHTLSSSNNTEQSKQFKYELKNSLDHKIKKQQQQQQQNDNSSFDFELIKKKVDSLIMLSSSYEKKKEKIKDSQDEYINKEEEEEEEKEVNGMSKSYLQKQDSVSLPLQSYFEYGGLNDIYTTSSVSDDDNSINRKTYSYIQLPKMTSTIIDDHTIANVDNDDDNGHKLNQLDMQKEKSPMIQNIDNKQKQPLAFVRDDNNNNEKINVHSMNYNKQSPALIQPINNNISSPKQQDTDENKDEFDSTGKHKSPIIDHSHVTPSLSNVPDDFNYNDHGFDYIEDNNNNDNEINYSVGNSNNDNDMDYNDGNGDNNNNNEIDHQNRNVSNIHEEIYISTDDKNNNITIDNSTSPTTSNGSNNVYITKDKMHKFINNDNIPSTTKVMPFIIGKSSSPKLTGIEKLPSSSKSPHPHVALNYEELFNESDNMDSEQDTNKKYLLINKDANMSKRFLDPTEAKLREQIPKYIIRDMFESQIDEKLNATCLSIIEQTSDAYLNQLCHDLKAYADHAGRKDITSEDMKLLMARQRLITKEKNLEALAHENLPRELWDEICVSALADNYLYPNL